MFKINILKKIFPSKSKSDKMIKTHDITGKDTEEKISTRVSKHCNNSVL